MRGSILAVVPLSNSMVARLSNQCLGAVPRSRLHSALQQTEPIAGETLIDRASPCSMTFIIIR